MPYKVFKSGSQFCVHKVNADGSKGSKIGCHPSRDKAMAQQRALYANEKPSAEMTPYVGEDGLWHIDNVPIISTGIEYPLATGPATFTEEQLADAVMAVEDPAIVSPRIGLGHSDKANELLMGDGEPAFGRVEELVLGANGQTVYGNYVGTPPWLANVLPVAYPNRSIEGSVDVDTVTGKRYKLVITAVKLLGVRWPGCQVLDDLPSWYGADIPDGAEIDFTESIAAAKGGQVQGAVDVSQVRRQFYTDVAQDDKYWWWIRAERVDAEEGMYLIVDDDQGSLFRYDVSLDDDNIAFSDPQEVVVQFEEKTAAARAAVVAGMAIAREDIAVYASRAETRPEDMPIQEGARMDDETRQALASQLDLPEDATPEQITAKITELKASTPEPDPPADPPDPEDDDDEVTPDPQPDPSATVTLDRATFERIKAGADTALAREETDKKAAVVDLVSAKVKDGTIPPARREHWLKAASADFDGTKEILDSMEPGLIPVNERGGAGSDSENIVAGQGDGLPDSWFPEISAIREQASRRQPVVQAKEG